MTKLSVHVELPHRGATNPLGGRRLPSLFIVGGALAAALIGVTFGTPPSGSIGKTVTAQAFLDSPRPEVVPAVEITKIVPAAPLKRNLSWSPLTSDDSN